MTRTYSLTTKKKIESRCKLKKLFLKACNYKQWLKNIESSDNDEFTGNEVSTEVKEVKRVTIFTPIKLLTRLPILLAQIKAANNSN